MQTTDNTNPQVADLLRVDEFLRLSEQYAELEPYIDSLQVPNSSMLGAPRNANIKVLICLRLLFSNIRCSFFLCVE